MIICLQISLHFLMILIRYTYDSIYYYCKILVRNIDSGTVGATIYYAVATCIFIVGKKDLLQLCLDGTQ